MKLSNRLDYRKRRHWRLRKKINGTAVCPRLCVCVTGRHIYVQFIDDNAGKTLASASTLNGEKTGKKNVVTAIELGKKAAEAAIAIGISEAVFDRGGNQYKGRVKAIAEAARETGLKI